MDTTSMALKLFDLLGNPRFRQIAQWFDEQAPYATTERTRRLDRYERYYWGLQYEDRSVAWDGRTYVRPEERLAITHPGNVLSSPPPWYFRRPFVRRGLCRAIVDRFTDLLFGEDRLPRIQPVSGEGQAWIDAAIKMSRWWERWSLARTLGGAVGSVVVAVKLRSGRPVVEVINSKWCRPMWKNDDPDTRELAALEVRYERAMEGYESTRSAWGVETRRWSEWREWYRRIITDEVDVVMTARLPNTGTGRLEWVVKESIEHGLGFVPAVWVTNTEISGGVDGAPDCDGLWDDLDALDALYSDAFVATHYNADPTLVIRSRREADQVALGSQTALLLWPEESAELLELRGSGGAAALEQAKALEKAILEDAACVLTPDMETGPTATHVLRREGQMIARADQLRRQYGAAMEVLFEYLLRVCRAAGQGLDDALLREPMPPDDDVTVVWPRYVQPTAQEEELHVRKVAQARAAGLMSRATAIRAIARYVGIDDPEAEIEAIEREESQRMGELIPELGMEPEEGGEAQT